MLIDIELPFPDGSHRKAVWENRLLHAGQLATDVDTRALAGKFRLTPGQISQCLTEATMRARWRSPAERRVTMDDLNRACRSQSAASLASLARKIEPAYRWKDIILPDEVLVELKEVIDRVNYRELVLCEWGFARKLSLGRGVNALFAGSSGTGKTMAAEIIARELGLDLYKIDLSGIVSKYIGETEKNLNAIFAAAENSNAILLFDEADAIFGKRSEVRDSHDRYANLEISYLLQKMEEYDGVAILATNLRQNLDESFMRRLAFTIHFPFPEESERRRIWTTVWPHETPLASDIDFDFLARQFTLSGGNIKNVSLASAFLAASNGGEVTMKHLLHATQREFQKMGKVISFGGGMESTLSRR
jgi:SpoVK/Ycf46/Vps4 family AAA+-type ATPase